MLYTAFFIVSLSSGHSLFKSRPSLQDALTVQENMPVTSDVPLRWE